MAGKFYAKTSKQVTVTVAKHCQVKKIKSCQWKTTSNGPVWCWMNTDFTNCPSQVISSGTCKDAKQIGKCQEADVSGTLDEMWMYDSLYKGRKSEPQPAGFYLKFSKTGWTPIFGDKGTNKPKKWAAKTVAKSGVANFFGATIDHYKGADFLQFHVCDGGLKAAPGSTIVAKPACVDEHKDCCSWAQKGECKKNPKYMLSKCRLSCKQCVGGAPKNCPVPAKKPLATCVDENKKCCRWAQDGEC